MIITVNDKGQITNIDDNILVANSTYGSAVIQVRLENAPKETVNAVRIANLSVIRADGLAINDLYMSVKQESGVGVYTSALTEDSGVFEIAGTIQISVQLKLSTGKIYSTITCTGFVQQNIGTLSKTEESDIERVLTVKINNIDAELGSKVDKLDANATYDLLYTQPSLKDDTDNSASRKVLKDGEALPHGILGTDGDGKYHVPRGADDDSPVTVGQLAETVSQKVDKADIGQAKGVAGLNEQGYVPLSQLPPVYSDIAVAFDKKVDKESIGQPDGVAGLDGDGKVPINQLPEIVGEIPDKVDKSVIGKAGGVAGLDATGKVPAANLPSYVDDVINAYVRPEGTLYGADWLSLTEGGAALTPEDGKVYIVLKGEYVNREYRWSGEVYAQIKGDLVLGEVTGTAYDGGKGKKTADDLATLTALYNAYIQKKITESQLDSGLTAKVNNNAKTNANNTFAGTATFNKQATFKNQASFYQSVSFYGRVSGFDEVAVSSVEPTGENTKMWVNPDEEILVSTIELTEETGNDPNKVMNQKGVTKALNEVLDNATSKAGQAQTTADNAQATATNALNKVNSLGSLADMDLPALINILYPVGSVKITTSSANPSTYITGTTWVAWGAGKVPVGVDTSDNDFKTAEKTGGEKTHTLTTNEMPAHTHSNAIRFYYPGAEGSFAYNAGDILVSTSSADITYKSTAGTSDKASSNVFTDKIAGNSAAHNILQPYITCYMWKRTA